MATARLGVQWYARVKTVCDTIEHIMYVGGVKARMASQTHGDAPARHRQVETGFSNWMGGVCTETFQELLEFEILNK